MQHIVTTQNNSADWARQNAFHAKLGKYVNGAVMRRRDLVWSLLGAGIPVGLNASGVITEYRALREQRATGAPAATQTVQIASYEGDHPCVLDMMAYLRERFSWELVGAYVHGSLGSLEPTAYSDFDALVILSDRVFDDRADLIRTCHALSGARRYMYRADPLQHHGWFVLTEADLRQYCGAYFPVELFDHSRSLLPDTGLAVTLSPRESVAETEAAFVNLAQSVLSTLEDGVQSQNAYRVKSILSRFMLLPSLYFQATTGTGIFKRHSFDVVRGEFSPDDWRAMEEVSDIRRSWDYEMTDLQRLLSGHVHCMRSRLLAAWGPAVSPEVSAQLSPDLLDRMARLTTRFLSAFESRHHDTNPRAASSRPRSS